MKKIISLFIMIMLMSVSTVYAQEALSIGTKFGAKLDSSDEAIYAGKALGEMGYHSYVDIVPMVSTVADEIKQYNTSSNTAGVFSLAGHGSPTSIEWNYEANGGYYAVGFYKDDTKPIYQFNKISALNLKKTKMGIFYGCNTAKNPTDGTYNIAKYAQTKGVKVTTGWVYALYDVDTNQWATAFFSKLKEGKTFREAYQYANSLSYPHNENMKTHRVYGDATVKIKLSSAKSVAANNLTNAINTDNRKIVSIKKNDKSDDLTLIQNVIKKEFDEEFNLSEYEIETSESPDGLIYDFNYIVENARTTHGYTAMVENENITIYDNMADFKEKIKSLSKYTIKDSSKKNINNQKEIKEKIDELIKKYSEVYNGYKVTYDSLDRIYDEKIYGITVNINIKIENPLTGGTSIITEAL